ncbi:hypothetical protein BDV10DRAFT_155420 [Aspergillus recurvatus]
MTVSGSNAPMPGIENITGPTIAALSAQVVFDPSQMVEEMPGDASDIQDAPPAGHHSSSSGCKTCARWVKRRLWGANSRACLSVRHRRQELTTEYPVAPCQYL